MKENPISIGIDDATFRFDDNIDYTFLIGVICQGTRMVKVECVKIEIDGEDSTEKIIQMVNKNSNHLQYIITHTITFGGFNLMDIQEVFNQTKKPLVAITEREVDLDSVKVALKGKFPVKYESKIEKIIKAGNLYNHTLNTAGGISQIYFHSYGLTLRETEELLDKTCIDSKTPEPVRMAHLIGRIFRNISKFK